MNKIYNEVLSQAQRNIDKKIIIGSVLTVIGGAGILFVVPPIPTERYPINDFATWAFSYTFFCIVAFSGVPGITHRRFTNHHLKIIDLVWMLGGAIGVASSLVISFDRSAEEQRLDMGEKIKESRRLAATEAAAAYKIHCIDLKNLGPSECDSLRVLSIVANREGIFPEAVVQKFCGFPIDLSNPPNGFTQPLINACIQSNYAAKTASDPIFADRENGRTWRLYINLWLYFLITLVALRVTKSVAEVFWKVK